jgi:uncharacterized protein YecE (DUF72 family)
MSMSPASKKSRIRVGTCSWTDKTLVEESDWYPKKSMSAEERLKYYASQFSITEADSTYYFPPTPQMGKTWAQRTPDDFVMNVKAYSLMTGHPTRPQSLWRDLREELPKDVAEKRNLYPHHLDPDALDEAWARFADALKPLHKAHKLGAVLFQYPPWFTPKRANRDELELVRKRLPNLPICVEFRAPAWLQARDRDRTLGVLRDLQLALVVVDAPKVSKLRTVVAATTDDLAVMRFHGRADDTWDARNTTPAERFKYLYNRRQLKTFVPKLEELAGQAQNVHALMNNCYRDFGVRNARDLKVLVED